MGSNLPTLQRIKFEDYKDAPAWFSSFLTSLNLFMNSIYNIVNGQVGYQNLVAPQIVMQTVTADTPTTMSFSNPLSIVPSVVILGNVYTFPANFSIHPSTPTTAFWHFSNNTVYIDDVTGLTPGIKYVLTFMVA